MMSFKSVLRFLTIILLVQSAITIQIPDFPPISYEANQIPDDNLETLFSLSESHYDEAVDLGVKSFDEDVNLENMLKLRGIIANEDDEFRAHLIESSPNENSRKLDGIARKIVKSNMYFVHKYCLPRNINPETCATYLMTKTLPLESEIHRKCEEIKDRGKHAYHRLLPARYKDGVYQIIDEPSVPRARQVAQNREQLMNPEDIYPSHNLLVMQWAQFIEHDLSKPVVTTMRNGDPIKCCTSDNQILPPRFRHPSCAPLLGNEPRDEYSRISCQNYVRNAQTLSSNCTFGPAVMLNEENGQLDLSQLYGLRSEKQNTMRAFKDGLLKSSRSGNIEASMLPISDDPSDYCVGTSPEKCYMAGDNRVNNNPFSTHLYTIFLRSHNLIASELKARYPNYSDETLYQLARKQNIEKYVGVIYHWWLPEILGNDVANDIRNKRNVRVKTVSNEFGVAAIRFYQSMMPDNVILGAKCSAMKSLNISKYVYNPEFLAGECEVNSLLEGMLSSNPFKADIYYNTIVLRHCLKSKENGNGINCLALDIQRGRDHGLGSYSKYLEQCSGKQIRDWNSLIEFIEPKELNVLKSIYDEIDDVDLLMGAMAERHTGGLLGTTFSCIIGDQFTKIWNQMDDQSNFVGIGLTPAELLCQTTSVEAVPENIFQVSSLNNRLVSCSDLSISRTISAPAPAA